MPFKIVQTIEDGRPTLVIVPSKWESNGSLYWPKRSEIRKLVEDGESAPKKGWDVINCKNKREYSTLEQANGELARMLIQSDTEGDHASENECVSSVRQKKKTTLFQAIDLNSHVPIHADRMIQQKTLNPLFEELNFNNDGPSNLEDVNIPAENRNKTTALFQQDTYDASHNIADLGIYSDKPDTTSNIVIEAMNFSSTQRTGQGAAQQKVTIVNPNPPESPPINEELPTGSVFYTPMQTLDTNSILGIILENQNQISKQMAVLQASIDRIAEEVIEIRKWNVPSLLTSSAPSEGNLSDILKPAKNVDDMTKMEKDLADKEYMDKIVSGLQFVCGTTGKAKGLDSCYKLIDYFIDRNLFTNVSWTGVSRTEGENKIPLKFYKNFITCFLTIVRSSDKQFTNAEVEMFFKRVIKNSKQRIVTKYESSTKRRQSKKSNKPVGLHIETPKENDVASEESVNRQGDLFNTQVNKP